MIVLHETWEQFLEPALGSRLLLSALTGAATMLQPCCVGPDGSVAFFYRLKSLQHGAALPFSHPQLLLFCNIMGLGG